MTNRKAQTRHLARYGISDQEYEELLELQGFQCAICRNDDDRTLAVDHCHRTERESGAIKVRGLLCQRCNTALGLFREDTRAMSRAIEYLGGSYEP